MSLCFVGAGPDRGKDETTARGEVMSGELGQPWYTAETPALF